MPDIQAGFQKGRWTQDHIAGYGETGWLLPIGKGVRQGGSAP